MTLKTRLDRLERQAGATDPMRELNAGFRSDLALASYRYLLDVLRAYRDGRTGPGWPPAPPAHIEPIIAAWPHSHHARPMFDWIEKVRSAPEPPPFPGEELMRYPEYADFIRRRRATQ